LVNSAEREGSFTPSEREPPSWIAKFARGNSCLPTKLRR